MGLISKIKHFAYVLNQIIEIEKIAKENYWANIFNSSTRGSWLNQTPLNVGRWAVNYSMLYILFRVLNEAKPIRIMELGLGETTKVLDAYKSSLNPIAECITIEHDPEWVKLRGGYISNNITLVELELENKVINDSLTLSYKNLCTNVNVVNKKFDLILIDGPFGSDKYSRYNIIELVENNFLCEEFIIIFDDYQREGEKQTIEAVIKTLTNMKITHYVSTYSGDKTQCLITSKKYKYLTSL